MGDDLAPVLEAIFTATERNVVDPFLSTGNNDWVVTVALPIFGGVVLLSAGLLIFFKVRKKKRLEAQQAEETVTDTLSEVEGACAEDVPLVDADAAEETLTEDLEDRS
jgi:hypothetical protein